MSMQEPGEVLVVQPGVELPRWWHASVFLAGPTTGSTVLLPWQEEAVDTLRRLWTGPGRLVVFVPRLGDGAEPVDGDDWSGARVDQSDIVLFWLAEDDHPVSRSVTHVLLGSCESTGRVVLGLPAHDPQGGYLRHRAERRRIPVATSIAATVGHALSLIGSGARRDDTHREIPLTLWRTDSFRHWLDTKEHSGHRLQHARVTWNLLPRPHGDVFLWAVRPHILINSEDRVKKNEIVIGRTDVASVVAYRPGATLLETEIALVREFRSPAATSDGYVHELPGGSQLDDAPPVQVAATEFEEETGLPLDPARLRPHGVRQPVGALCAHRQHLFSAELDEEEISRLRSTAGTFGLADEGERTTVEVRTYREILSDRLVDWTTLGLLSAAFAEVFAQRGTGSGRRGTEGRSVG
ncbi:hypothetical protein ACI2K4_06695 [Micromonospora sp. NPDC050397]|uniref:hypothetical protein n=1 Tax=Micromonospora sp. NPDC050397 TaxID=3364279 RepID=UPI00384AAE6C